MNDPLRVRERIEERERSAREWLAFFKRFTFKFPFMGGVITLDFDIDMRGNLAIIIPMHVADRDVGTNTIVTFGSTHSMMGLEHYRQRGESVLIDYATRIVFEAIRSALLHEVDEMLCFDGKVLRDPHPIREVVVLPTVTVDSITLPYTVPK